MMGIETNEDLPQPGEYWTMIDVANGDGEQSGTKVLRPKDAPAYDNTLTQDTVDALQDKDLKSLTGKVSKNMKEWFKEQSQPPGEQSANVQNIRHEKHQSDSTDYSDSDASIGEHPSGNEDGEQSCLPTRHKAYKKKKKSTILTTRPPCWCSKWMREIIQDVCEAVDEELSKKDNKKKTWMKKHALRVQGPPIMAMLPTHSMLKTPQWAVSTQWLNSLDEGDHEYALQVMTDYDPDDHYPTSPAESEASY
ncbi:hypothetical protein BDR05DRAFT_1004478 [Suillus weaverae]|nr:hypothetical protein BDR05DRAFT_1004478 [Suillus weaverae]